MEEKKSMLCAGSLVKELDEINKIQKDAEAKITGTFDCMAFLTIYCC